MRFLHFRTILTLIAALGLLLAGCLPRPSTEVSPRTAPRRPPAAGEAPAPTTITWSFWGNDWEVDVNRRVARAFEAENPSIKVELIHQPWEAYFGWLENQWRQGTAPDVMFLNNIRGYASGGHLEPLDAYIIRDHVNLSDFYPRLLELFNFNNYYYGLPRDNDTKVIYYNKALFAEAGLDPPRSGWTWTDLRNLASRLTRRDAAGRPLQYGFAFEAEMWWRMWVWQNGGDILDDPLIPTRVRLGEPRAVEAIQFLSDLIKYDRVTPPVEVLLSSDRITQLFREGRLAMAFGGHGKIPLLAEEPELKWDVVGLPMRQQRANLAGGAGYTIWASSQKKDAAWALVRFLESEKGQAMFAESGLIVPARRSIREDSIFLRQQPYSVQVFAEETEFGRPNLNIPQAGEINRLANTALAPVWRGERTAAEAVAELEPLIRYLVER
jgi:multiple sugar transport system substrate-binding protein